MKNTLKNTGFTDQTEWIDGLPAKERRPDFWAKILSELMDIFTFAAIYLTTEVRSWPFLIAGGLTLVRYVFRYRFRPVWMVSGFLFQIFLGILLILRVPLHPIVAAAHIAPLAMAWIGLARGSEDLWGWRMALGFIGLILASALTPDFSIMLFILAFIVSGSTGIACRFLSDEFTRRGVIGTLPQGFIRTSFYQSGILLLSALLIFPLIPRIAGKGGGVFGNDTPKTGYAEDVNLSAWTRVSGQGSNTPALRIYGPNGSDPSDLIPGGLLRSRVLNLLDSNHWNPAPVKSSPDRLYLDHSNTPTLMIVREMTGTANLPVPYGTRDVSVEIEGFRWSAERTFVGEWREGRAENQRFNYYAAVETSQQRRPQDVPTSIELAVPQSFRSARMNALVEKLFQDARTPEKKISAIQSFFQKERFLATYAEDERPEASIEDQKLPPIERFLFAEKSGHCELFSSAMAVLLRMGGVPTRLIAGFRVSRNAYGDVLTVRQSDAHAWVEAYIPATGWTVLDPTPKILHFATVTDWLRDTYDWASAKWTQYILNYGQGENSLLAQWKNVKKFVRKLTSGENPFKSGDVDTNAYLFGVIFIVGSILLSSGAVMVFRRIRRTKREPGLDRFKIELQAERRRIERLPVTAAPEVTEKIQHWHRRYERERFGAPCEDPRAALTALRESRIEIEKSLRRNA